MSCSYVIRVVDSASGNTVQTFQRDNAPCTKNQTFTVQHDKNSSLTFQCPVDGINEPILDASGKPTSLSYNGYCFNTLNKTLIISIVLGVISFILLVLVIVLIIKRRK